MLSIRARRRRGSVACAGLVVATLAPSLASADVLTVRTVEYGSWSAAVSALQSDLYAEGRVLTVYVRDESGRPVGCDRYQLGMDLDAARAFSIAVCDPATGTTPVRLDHRAALFARASAGVTLLAPALSAAEIVTAPATTGPATGPTPAATVLIGEDAERTVAQARPAMARRVGTTCRDAPRLEAGAPMEGTTLGGARRPVYRVDASEPSTITLQLTSEFGGEIDVFAGCPRGRVATYDSLVFGGGPSQRLQFDVSAGVFYFVLIDADVHSHTGAYSFVPDLVPSLASIGREDVAAAPP